MVPRSLSRVMASPVMMTSVMVSTTPMRPGTMLYCVMTSGLYMAWTRRSKGPLVPATKAGGPLEVVLKRGVQNNVQGTDGIARG